MRLPIKWCMNLTAYLQVLILYLGLAVRIEWLLRRRGLTTDEKVYWERSRKLVFQRKSDFLILFYKPFKTIEMARLATTIINLLAGLTVYRWARVLGLNEWEALTALTLYVFNPLTIYFAPRLLGESLMYFLVPLYLSLSLEGLWFPALLTLVLMMFIKPCLHQMLFTAVMQNYIMGRPLPLALFLAVPFLPISSYLKRYVYQFGLREKTLFHLALAFLSTILYFLAPSPQQLATLILCLSYHIWFAFFVTEASIKDLIRLSTPTIPGYCIMLAKILWGGCYGF